MIAEHHKILIHSHLLNAIAIDMSGFITPKNEFDREIRNIKDFKLRKNIPSDEVHALIEEYLIGLKCSSTMIKQFFEWSSL